MSPPWSAGQQRILSALGYSLYTPAVAPAASAPVESTKTADRLASALLLAAGLDPVAMADADGWLRGQQLPPLALLRADPSAKRAIWPRLRALRRARAGS